MYVSFTHSLEVHTMSQPFPLLSAVLDDMTDDVLDFIDSHSPDEFGFWESEDLPTDVLDVLDSWEAELLASGDL